MRRWSKEVWSWCIFDVANSAYTTLIITVAYSVIFSQLVVGPDPGSDGKVFSQGNFAWSLVLSVSWVVAAIAGPWIGRMTDHRGQKKQMLMASALVCSVGSALLYTVDPGAILWASVLIVITNLAFALSENFISAFLPHVTTPENVAAVSGMGWGIGYVGGLLSVVLCGLIVPLEFEMAHYESLRWVGPLTGIFFLLFAIPAFVVLKEPPAVANPLQGAGLFERIAKVWADLKALPELRKFLLSFFFFQGGLSIVISFAALYGQQEIGLSGTFFIIFFVAMQVFAGAGSVGFGFLQGRIGPVRTVNLTLLLWIVATLWVFFVKDIGSGDVRVRFLFAASLAGLCLGATQASARAVVAILSPANRSGEFFGFWGLSGKLSMVFGVLVFGLLQTALPIRWAILSCGGFFVLGLFGNLFVDEKRGIAQARAAELP